MKRNLIFAATAAAMMLVASCTRGKETAENNNTGYTLSGQQSAFEQENSAPAQADETIAESLPEEQPQEIAIVTEEEYKSLYAEKNDDPTKPKMIFVEGGAFRLSTNWQNYNNGTVCSFEIGETEVTVEQYCTITGEIEFNEEWKNHPISGVNWYEAVIFCNRLSMKYGYEPCYTLNGETDPSLWGNEIPYFTESDGNVGDMTAWNAIQCNFNANGYRLPTKVEWAFAARGGTKSNHTKFSGSDNVDEVGWTEENTKERQQVATKKSNELGIYDMSGNVWEWCWDRNVFYSSESEYNPTRSAEVAWYRVIRGGGWGTPAEYSEITYYSTDEPDVQSWYYGFRLCRSIRKR